MERLSSELEWRVWGGVMGEVTGEVVAEGLDVGYGATLTGTGTAILDRILLLFSEINAIFKVDTK